MPLYSVSARFSLSGYPGEGTYEHFLVAGDNEAQVRDFCETVLPKGNTISNKFSRIEYVKPVDKVITTQGRESKLLVVQGDGTRYEINDKLYEKIRLD